ncbi:hypothetical protein [Geofilum rubicundum]|uniref:Uncharacterized protein n=1 Tax=Geofilum rubicundum JCM 15548 TaxID=1236989 RepID=A0A0E9LRM3_9BACT|nr:hypothetical protein [Geofilum rubicundum]GAO28247.1 hypothetical protein JCM15548_1313 [Geofilum rubicundum JCM 15548]
MEKEALLTIILQDIKELETLVTTFKGKSQIPDVFIQLSKSKTQGILDEIQLLASIKETPVVPVPSVTPEKPAAKPPEAELSVEEVVEKPTVTEPEKVVVEKTPEPSADKPREPEKKTLEPAVTVTPKNSNNATVIGELLGKNKPSFNERLAEKQEPVHSKSHPPIDDLRKAIGINDRFFFQRELFGGNTELFNQTIDQLNGLNNMEAASAFISANFNWNPQNEAVTSFMALLKRRFANQ